MGDKKEYTLTELRRDKEALCRKISDLITDFEIKYDVTVVELLYEIGEYDHFVDIMFKVR